MSKGADVVVMLHPDYQYSPRLITAMASMILSGHYDVVLGSRILGGGAMKGGMPVYKYISNRFLSLIGNLALGVKLSEYHTGYRVFHRKVLETLPLEENSDDFVFDKKYWYRRSTSASGWEKSAVPRNISKAPHR